MTDDEKYLFDLNGYLVVEDVLTPDELAQANDAVDRHLHEMINRPDSLADDSPTLRGTRTRGELGGMLNWPEPDGPVFRNILTHPRLVPYLNLILGYGFRVDHYMFMLEMQEGTEGFYMHGAGGLDFDPAEYYHFKNGKFYSGLTVVGVQLHDVNPGDGGLVIVPGSHKANFNAPRGLTRFEKYQECVRQVSCRAGGAVIFSEAVTHGTLPWKGKQSRRSLLTRYNRGGMAYVPSPEIPAWAGEREKAVLQPPYHWRLQRPKLER